MLIYSIIFIIFFIILFSCGLTFKSIIGNKDSINNSTSFLITFFYGLIFLSFLSSCISIFSPLNCTITIAFACLGIVGVIINYKTIIKFYVNFKLLSTIDLIVVSFLFIFLVFISSNGIYNYDSGLYHVQDIKWSNQYAVVPGLGNLHGRLALNSLFFTISSVFSIDHFFSKEILMFPLNTICLYVFLVWQYFNLKKYKIKTDIAHIVFITILVLLIFRYDFNWISSTSTDVICSIICIIVLQISIYNKFEGDLVFITCLIFTCITFKLSTLMLLLFIILFIKKICLFKDVQKIIVIATLVLLPFFIRNYFLSGYLVYPFPVLDLFNPDWKIPIDDVTNIKLIVETWAIIPNIPLNEVLQLTFTEWFPMWLERWDILTKIILSSSLCLPIISINHYLKKKYNSALICLFTFINLLFWFFIAPDPRFAQGFIIFTFAYITHIIIESFRYKLTLTVTGIGLISLGLFFKFQKTTTTKNMVIFHMLNNSNEILIYPKGFNDQDYKKVKYEKLNTGFDYYKPILKDKCYNCEIPCTPTNVKEVMLRTKDLKDGFKVNTVLQKTLYR